MGHPDSIKEIVSNGGAVIIVLQNGGVLNFSMVGREGSLPNGVVQCMIDMYMSHDQHAHDLYDIPVKGNA